MGYAAYLCSLAGLDAVGDVEVHKLGWQAYSHAEAVDDFHRVQAHLHVHQGWQELLPLSQLDQAQQDLRVKPSVPTCSSHAHRISRIQKTRHILAHIWLEDGE